MTTEKRGPGRPKKDAERVDDATDAANPVIEELTAANAAFNEENERLRRELEAAKSALTKDVRLTQSKRFEAQEQQIGQDGVSRFDEDGLVRVEQKTLDDPFMKEKMDMLAFMEEMVTVEIAETSEDQADPGFIIWVNNKPEKFFRGQTKTVKRYFVEGLARAKKTGFANRLVTDHETGIQEYQYPSKTGLRYPFSVIEDKNPKGRDWLKQVLRQP